MIFILIMGSQFFIPVVVSAQQPTASSQPPAQAPACEVGSTPDCCITIRNKGIANEIALIAELKDLLHRFTDADKKLDPKEKDDALQFVCRSRPGFNKGLVFEVANRCLLEFCRTYRVKIKTGFMKWQIP